MQCRFFADLLYYIYTVKKKWFLGNFGDSGFLLIFMIYSFYNPIYPPKTTEVTTSVVFPCLPRMSSNLVVKVHYTLGSRKC